jgi:hypothetical protein
MNSLRSIGEDNAYPLLVSVLSGIVAIAAFAGIAHHFASRPDGSIREFRAESVQLFALLTEEEWHAEAEQRISIRTALAALGDVSLADYKRYRSAQMVINKSLLDIRRAKALMETKMNR